MKKAIDLSPNDVDAYSNLGVALGMLGRFVEAEAMSQAAVRLKPADAESHYNLGNIQKDLGKLPEAVVTYRKAIQLKPDFAEAYSNLGAVLNEINCFSEAKFCCQEAIRLKPNFATKAQSNLGNILKDLGRLREAEVSYREAIRLDPDNAEAHSNLLFSLNYVESLSTEAALEEARRYGDRVSVKAEPKFCSWSIDSESKKLRIGLVSGDFINHPVGYFVEGLIKHLDQSQFELYAFPAMPKTDDLTDRIKSHFQAWHPIYGKADREAATVIHEQGIHVLIDLSGHSAHNRLPVFAYKPAPVQISWLGYFATTGLPEMDYFLGDPIMSPPREQHHFTEKIWNLPETWLCLTPPSPPVPISALPAQINGYVTFGCFGNLSKMNDQVVKAWSDILQRVPNSKLFLKTKQLADPKAIEDVQRQFVRQGISADRLILEGPSSRTAYFEAYNRIDMVLDTFPYPGGTTSVDALWMGIPVLTLKGDRFLSHLGESIATNAGQSDWIAQDHDEYVRKADAFASDPQKLAEIRLGLRDRVLQTPLFDTQRFAKGFGEALWGMWSSRQKSF